MTDYIKREDAIKELLGCVPTDVHEIKDLDVIRLMLALPSADVAPVVRCRDCAWWTKQEASCQGRCARLGIYPTGTWYCANGAKMDEGESDGTDDC